MNLRLQTIRVTRKFRFEMAHALTGHDGPCRNIHGHSYQLSVTVSGKPLNDSSDPKNGMVIDFSELKKIVTDRIVSEFDHALVLHENDRALSEGLTGHRIILFPFAPSCEMLLVEFLRRIKNELPENLELARLRLDETETSYAEWYAEDNL